MRKRCALLWLALLCLSASSLWAQGADPARSFDAATLGDRVELDHGWLFHAGDDPSWASPQLDDRDWKEIDIHKPLSDYDVAPDTQYCWMRLHVVVPPGRYPPLALGMYTLFGSYQVYVDGKLTAEAGNMTDHLWSSHARVTRPLAIDLTRIASSRTIVIASRFAIVRSIVAENPPQNPFVGGPPHLGSQRSITFEGNEAFQGRLVEVWSSVVPAGFIGLIALGLFLYPPRAPFLGWLALSYLARASEWTQGLPLSLTGYGFSFVYLAYVLRAIGTVLFPWSLLQFRRVWLLVVLLTPTLTGAVFNLAWVYGFRVHDPSGRWWDFLSDSYIPLSTAILLWAAMRGRREAQILAPGSCLVCSSYLFWFARLFGWTSWNPAYSVSTDSSILSYDDIVRSLDMLNALIFFAVYVISAARQSYRAKTELAAAQTVQQLLLGDDVPESENFSVHTAYLPANEVGGDFFLVSPGPDGSLTALVGDVAGKGLQAAMRVSMIVGALRREAAREPAVILNNLNGVLLAEKVRGFTTVCCVHLRADGTLLVANAGHLWPVIVGGGGTAREMETEPALPLGFAEEPVPQTAACLQPGERLMLCSDGVPEARDRKTRELMGFGRMLELAGESAESIAQAAKKFGQEDDITVLTIALR